MDSFQILVPAAGSPTLAPGTCVGSSHVRTPLALSRGREIPSFSLLPLSWRVLGDGGNLRCALLLLPALKVEINGSFLMENHTPEGIAPSEVNISLLSRPWGSSESETVEKSDFRLLASRFRAGTC